MPTECLGAYIVSMASNVSDVLVVMLLQKEAGMKSYLRVVPLFETNVFTECYKQLPFTLSHETIHFL